MTTISIAIQKGGSGKTTTAINLGAELERLGHRVLLIDIDPQANLSQSLGIEEDTTPNVNTLLRATAHGEEVSLLDATLDCNGVDVIPSSLDLAQAELELTSVYGRERLLEQLLEPHRDDYDFIFLDCPPSLGMLTVNALTASDYVLLPLQGEYLPFKGMMSFNQALKVIKKQLNGKIEVLGYVLTKFDARKRMNQQIHSQLLELFGPQVFETCIRTNIALAQAQEHGVDIHRYNPRSNGAKDYKKLAEEFMSRVK